MLKNSFYLVSNRVYCYFSEATNKNSVSGLKRLDRKEVPLFHVEKVSPAFLFSFWEGKGKNSVLLTVEIFSEVVM